ncbi:MAG: hypothetical protein V1716_03145 [Candidatus Uhrbacteria bacterium]
MRKTPKAVATIIIVNNEGIDGLLDMKLPPHHEDNSASSLGRTAYHKSADCQLFALKTYKF